MFEVIVFFSEDGASPFEDWFNNLDALAAVKVTTAIARIEAGNLGDVKPVGQGVSERRIPFGSGYRLYFGQDGETLIVLLAGGTKRRQPRDIARAQVLWAEYKRRKKGD
ncbi:MAG: type II toxin-antitoxin system RelE/ParE family toxin [Silicimonas sp.]|nr:type II toxin-antitoxin system RelE/ParE family toxin [Silicimonas sp.]